MNGISKNLFAMLALFCLVACESGGGVFPMGDDPDDAAVSKDTGNTVTNVVNGADASTSIDAASTDVASTDIPATATPANCEDKDGDKYCVPLDCDDNNPNVHPGAKETCATLGVDDNCDGKTDEGLTETVYLDKDKDGFGLSKEATLVCAGAEPPKGYSPKGGDCNDSAGDANGDGKVDGYWISPAATETCDDGIDNNCDGKTDEGCAPEVEDLKAGDNFAIAVIWPADKVGQKIYAVEYYSEAEIGADWTLKEASATNNVLVIVPDGNACGVRFQTAFGNPATEWLVEQIDDKGTLELDKSALVMLIKADGSIKDVTKLVTTWPAPGGGGSALLKLHACK